MTFTSTNPKETENVLLCPLCKSALTYRQKNGQSQVLCCSNQDCLQNWEIKNGIPDFLPENLSTLNDSSADGQQAPIHGTELETDFHQNVKQRSVLRNLYVDYAFAIRQQILVEHTQRLGRQADILDIGSGALLSSKTAQEGRHFNMLKTYSRSYKGIEPSWHMINQVNVPGSNLYSLSSALLVRGVGESLPFPKESCDVVFFLSMLDHVTNPEKVLLEARSVLQPGGIVIISLQNYQSWQRRLARSLMPNYMNRREQQDHHNWRFTPDAIRELLQQTGYVNAVCIELNYLTFPRLHSLENLLFSLPSKLMGKAASLNLLQHIDANLAKLFPERGGTFIVYASRP